MAKRVGIVAVAQTKFAPSRRDVNMPELANEVIQAVLAETGLQFGEHGTGIDSSTLVCDDIMDGRTLGDMEHQAILGGNYNDSLRIPQDGVQAIIYSAATIMGGHDDVILVVGVTKESLNRSRNTVSNFGVEPIFTRPLGIDYLSAAGMQAMYYLNKNGISREQCAKVVVKNRKNAAKNPVAQARTPVTVEEVLKAKMLAAPIGELDAYPVTDGAVAMILAVEDKAKRLTKTPVWITGMGFARDVHELGGRDLAACESLTEAAKQAYRMAGITDPKKEIDLVELTEEYSYQELLWSEGLGLCPRGGGGKLIDSGKTELNGQLPINASGGLLSGVPLNVAGLSRTAEAVLQLRGEAGDRQVAGARTAVAQGISGPAGQLQSLLLLSN